ncbi:MAG TPA: hypothetical protein VMW91_11410 [Desulfosporosinus sp.]|nr:hypothetical protein [Desulfosporosinus sp.]
MEDQEQKGQQPNAPVAQAVTHEQLAAAALEAQGQPPEQELEPIQPSQPPQEPQQPEARPAFELVEEPTDQGERSNLGRKVKKIEDSVASLVSKLDQYFSQPPQPSQFQAPTYQQPQEPPEEEIISTAADVRRVLAGERERETNTRKQYEDGFIREVQGLGNENPDLHNDILHEMFNVPNSPYNQYRTGDPRADAAWNYSRAMASVFKRKAGKPQQPVNPPIPPTGISVGTQGSPSNHPQVQLDEHAQKFLSQLQGSTFGPMKEDSIRKAVGNK